MHLTAITPARNESWILRASIPAMLRFCDDVWVLLHACTDNTRDILATLTKEYPARVHTLYEWDPTWREAAYRQRLLSHAVSLGATHVATVDADELLTANAVERIRPEIESLAAGQVLRVPWFMLWGSLDQYRAGDDSVWSSATAPVAFRVDGAKYPVTRYDIHTRVPAGLVPRNVWFDRSAGLMHLQHASRARVAAKQSLYRMNERIRWNTPVKDIERKYGPTTDETGMRLQRVPDGWWGPERKAVDVDAEPWQAGEVRRLLSESAERFVDLNIERNESCPNGT
jgi:hypothetical protein